MYMLQHPFFLWFLWNLVLAIVIISFVFFASRIKSRLMGKVDFLVSLSVGLILALVFLGFIPEVISHGGIDPKQTGSIILAGIGFFYILELFLHWHHCKDLWEDGHTHHDHEHHNSPLISIGTFFDNFIHGTILFSAFSVDISFGITTCLALLLHAIPQNIANFLMNHKNLKFVYIASLGGILWALAIYPFQAVLTQYMFHILAFIAGWLLYTAMSDILPSFKKKWNISHKISYLAIMILGVGCFILLHNEDHSHGSTHTHQNEHTQETHHAEHNTHIHE